MTTKRAKATADYFTTGVAYKKGDVITFDKALRMKDCRVTRVRKGIVETEPLKRQRP